MKFLSSLIFLLPLLVSEPVLSTCYDWPSEVTDPDGRLSNLTLEHTLTDPSTGRKVRIGYANPFAHESIYGAVHTTTWYQVSPNSINGQACYDEVRIIIQQGQNELEPIKSVAGTTLQLLYKNGDPYVVEVGKNGVNINLSPPVWAGNGNLILAFSSSPFDSTFVSPCSVDPGNYNPYCTSSFTYVGTLIGRWNSEGDDLIWDVSNIVDVHERTSTRGFLEPSVVELEKPGHMLMTMRASNERFDVYYINNPYNNPSYFQSILPTYTWKSISYDYGKTWSAASPLTYDSGDIPLSQFNWVFEATKPTLSSGSIEAPVGSPESAWVSVVGGIVEINNGTTSIFDTTMANVNSGMFSVSTSSEALQLDSAKGYTIAWRARLLEITGNEADTSFNAASLRWEDASANPQFWSIGLGRSGKQDYVRLQGPPNSSGGITHDISPGFHTFYVVVKGNQATLYVDNGIAIGSVEPRTSIEDNQMVLGDQTGNGADSRFEVDYIRIYAQKTQMRLPYEDTFSSDTEKPEGSNIPVTISPGIYFQTSSSLSTVLRSSKNNRLYWFGNITDIHPLGNSPRYPLVISELDEHCLCLKRETVRIIATYTPHLPAPDDDTYQVQYSNLVISENSDQNYIVSVPHLDLGKTERRDPPYDIRTYIVEIPPY